jgi:hypothetical protein
LLMGQFCSPCRQTTKRKKSKEKSKRKEKKGRRRCWADWAGRPHIPAHQAALTSCRSPGPAGPGAPPLRQAGATREAGRPAGRLGRPLAPRPHLGSCTRPAAARWIERRSSRLPTRPAGSIDLDRSGGRSVGASLDQADPSRGRKPRGRSVPKIGSIGSILSCTSR